MVPANVLSVPPYVLQHIAKGSKFIPTCKPRSLPVPTSALDALRRSLLIRKVFPLSDGKPSTCRLKSAWTPPGDEKVDVFMRLLRADLVHFDAAEHRSNLTWIDRKASAWLKQHVDTVAVIDADKDLGDAIVLRSWVHQQVLFQLSQGYVQLSDAEVQTKMRDSKFQSDALIQFFLSSSTISLAVAKFLLSKFYLNYAGTFRILAKVHKFPTASRPICNLRGMWLAPLATFLIANLHTVIVSTDQLLSQLRDLQVSPDMAFVTLDIVNLYPSVDRSHFMSLVSSFLHSAFSRIRCVSLLCVYWSLSWMHAW